MLSGDYLQEKSAISGAAVYQAQAASSHSIKLSAEFSSYLSSISLFGHRGTLHSHVNGHELLFELPHRFNSL